MAETILDTLREEPAKLDLDPILDDRAVDRTKKQKADKKKRTR